MIQLTYKQLSDTAMLNALRSLMNARTDVKSAYNLKRMADAIMKARAEVTEAYMTDIVQKLGKKDESGKVATNQESEHGFDLAEGITDADFEKAHAEFGTRTKVIDRHFLNVAVLNSSGVSPAELNALEPLLDAESMKQLEDGPTGLHAVK